MGFARAQPILRHLSRLKDVDARDEPGHDGELDECPASERQATRTFTGGAASGPSAAPDVPDWTRNSSMISAFGRALLNRKPCPSWQPSARRQLSSASVSTPSAVMVTPRPLPRLTIDRTIAWPSRLEPRSRTNDWSILILSNGKLLR